MDFDAIVIGSGITGGWAAKELAEQGFKVLVLERGQHVERGKDYHDMQAPWEMENRGRVAEPEIAEHYAIQSKSYAFSSGSKQFWVKDSDHPYTTPEGKPFHWMRGYHLGGRSITWGRQSYRWSDIDFEANSRDGHGVDWPIRYADLAPWYDRVERFIGVSGSTEGVQQLPDGVFQKPFEMTAVEKDFQQKLASRFPGRRLMIGRCAHLTAPTEEQTKLGRGPCQSRNICERGCTLHANFTSLSGTLPAAERTGNLTVITDAIVDSIAYDGVTGRANGVRVINANSRERSEHRARVVFLCASTIASAQILLNSKSEAFPTGLANRSDQVGRNLMDHIGTVVYSAVPGFLDRYYWGRRPTGSYLPRYRNVTEPAEDFVRGFGYQVYTLRTNWTRNTSAPGVGASFKEQLRQPGGWLCAMGGFGEMLPDQRNRITLEEGKRDKWGIPLVRIDVSQGPNEEKMLKCIRADARAMMQAAGYFVLPMPETSVVPGANIHEMGTARMGRDPRTSVLNANNAAHDVANLYVTDGACMASSAWQNPSLTYMALTARAARHAGDQMRAGIL